jgi:3D (Asp-Asp-Asp) domain-containing protein
MIRRVPLLIVWMAVAILASALAGCRSISPPSNVAATGRRMEVTAYCKCGDCCGWRRNWFFRPVVADGPQAGQRKAVGITASGTKARRGVISADTSRYPMGTVMHVPGYGYGRVEDCGSGVKGDHIEVFFRTHGQALDWGRQRLNVSVWGPPPAAAAR